MEDVVHGVWAKARVCAGGAGEGADVALHVGDVGELWTECEDGGEVDAVDVGGEVGGGELVGYDAGAAANVEDGGWGLEGSVEDFVVH